MTKCTKNSFNRVFLPSILKMGARATCLYNDEKDTVGAGKNDNAE